MGPGGRFGSPCAVIVVLCSPCGSAGVVKRRAAGQRRGAAHPDLGPAAVRHRGPAGRRGGPGIRDARLRGRPAMEARIERVTSPGSDGAPGRQQPGSWATTRRSSSSTRARDAGAVLAAVGEREILAVICTHGHASHVARRPRGGRAGRVPDRAASAGPCCSGASAKAGDDPEIDMAGRRDLRGRRRLAGSDPRPRAHARGRSACTARNSRRCSPGDTLLASGPAPHQDEYPDFPAQLSAIGEHLLTLDAADPGAARARRGDHGGGRVRSGSTPG